MYQGFYCHFKLKVLYIGVVCLGVAASIAMASSPKMLADKYAALRNTVYVFTVAFAVVPLGHFLVLCSNHSDGVCDPAFFEAAVIMYVPIHALPSTAVVIWCGNTCEVE